MGDFLGFGTMFFVGDGVFLSFALIFSPLWGSRIRLHLGKTKTIVFVFLHLLASIKREAYCPLYLSASIKREASFPTFPSAQMMPDSELSSHLSLDKVR